MPNPNRADVASRLVAAPAEAIYRAFMGAADYAAWLPPKGMTASVDFYDPRVGGAYRVSSPTIPRSKASAARHRPDPTWRTATSSNWFRTSGSSNRPFSNPMIHGSPAR